MKVKELLLASLLICLIFPIAAQIVIIPKSEIIEIHNNKAYYVHTVQNGQTIYSIAKVYDVTPEEIYFENPETRQGLSINQEILIRTVNKETELNKEVVNTKFNFFYHLAANNQTFEQISSIYSIPEKYIVKANPDLHPPLREGEYVKVPVEQAFDILDGKVTQQPVEINKPVENKYNSPKTSINQPHKLTNTTVSFNPDIPVIQDYRHVVVAGETTQSIANKYDVPVNVLKSVNPGLSNCVVAGNRLRIPDKAKLNKTDSKYSETNVVESQEVSEKKKKQKTTSVNQELETIKHKVKKKETLYSIGREYGVTVAEIYKANLGISSNISIGQIINIPKIEISEPFLIHNVEDNIKVSKIAKLYRIPTYQIIDFNPNLGKWVYENQKIKIPVGSHAVIMSPLPVDEEILEDEATPLTPPAHPNIIVDNCNFSPDKNRVFKVALMIPLFLEEADSINRQQFLLSPQNSFIPFRFIQFYEGLLIALDSLTGEGMNVEMFVYDVDKNITKTTKVLQQRELQNMDMIIGPFYGTSFNQVALFAGNFNIPIINPLSHREEIVNKYETVIKTKPGILAQSDMIKTFINTFSKNSKIFLISQTSYVDADKVIEINNGIMSVMEPQFKVSNNNLFDLSYLVAERDTLYDNSTLPPPFTYEGTEIYPEFLENTLTDSTILNNYLTKINYSNDSLYPFYENASPLRNNLVILYGTKKSFILDVLNRLNESRDTFDIELIGMPSWDRINNLSNVKMNNLNLSYFSSSYIDYESEKTQDFIHKYRNKFGCEPNSYAFSGFDLTYYFLKSLFYLGDDFNNCLEYYPMKLLQSKYYFTRIGNSNNFENSYWNMLEINNMSKKKIPDSIISPEKQRTINEKH